ncbi:MAG: hypothetical protein ABIH42_06135 [Planctomycetota bacterium]
MAGKAWIVIIIICACAGLGIYLLYKYIEPVEEVFPPISEVKDVFISYDPKFRPNTFKKLSTNIYPGLLKSLSPRYNTTRTPTSAPVITVRVDSANKLPIYVKFFSQQGLVSINDDFYMAREVGYFQIELEQFRSH